MKKLLVCLSLLAFAAGCSTSGKEPIMMGGDQGGKDALVDQIAESDVIANDLTQPPEETVEVSCLVCKAVECGLVDDCDCGGCEEGFTCFENTCVVVPEPCAEICMELACGEVDDCNCGECQDGAECLDGVCIETCGPVCEDPDSGDPYQCGDDGCDGSCGECADYQTCEEHLCVGDPPLSCDEMCAAESMACGDLSDDCNCGACGKDEVCTDGLCQDAPPDCDEVCDGKECGTIDGCDCGVCAGDEECNEESMCQCLPQCDGKECGPDGCGSICGECSYGECTGSQCVCTPTCAGKSCGSNGCGGSCGSCPNSEICAWIGQCLASCTPNTVLFSNTAEKLNSMFMALTGMTGNGLDVDGNPSTCAPWGKCENGIDNSMGTLFDSIGAFVDINAQLEQGVNSGSIILIAELAGYNPNALPFSVNMYIGDAVMPKNQCNFQTQTCDYQVEGDAINWNTCMPMVTFDNAKVVNNVLTAGGLGYMFDFVLPFFSGQPLLMPLYNARIQATVQLANGQMKLIDGVIAGAVKKEILVDAVEDLPDQGLPVSKDMIKNLLNMLITHDIDTDGDGVKDAASMGIKFTAIAGNIVGVF